MYGLRSKKKRKLTISAALNKQFNEGALEVKQIHIHM